MSDKQSSLQKAITYDLLSSYYKYSNPHLHDYYYYHKHLKSFEKEAQQLRFEQMNVILPAQVRIIHAAPTAPSFDVYLNEMRILKNFSFKENNDYSTFPPGNYQLDIYPAAGKAPHF